VDLELEKKLLKDKRVVEEIHRHLWIESEKAGYDIGFDKAKEDWLKNFSKAWLDYHMPKLKHPADRQGGSPSIKKNNDSPVRRAKTFLF
jgi:hypothetical protein